MIPADYAVIAAAFALTAFAVKKIAEARQVVKAEQPKPESSEAVVPATSPLIEYQVGNLSICVLKDEGESSSYLICSRLGEAGALKTELAVNAIDEAEALVKGLERLKLKI